MQFNRLEPDFAVSGQIAVADVAGIAAEGFKALVNNRPDGEAPDQPTSQEIGSEAARHGLLYRYIPIQPGQMTEDSARGLLEVIRSAGGPTFAYCRSGARSTNLYKAAQQIAGARE